MVAYLPKVDSAFFQSQISSTIRWLSHVSDDLAISTAIICLCCKLVVASWKGCDNGCIPLNSCPLSGGTEGRARGKGC